MEVLLTLIIFFGAVVFIVRLIAGIVYRARRSASFNRMSSYIFSSVKEINNSRNIISFDDTGYYNRALVIDDSSKKICVISCKNHKFFPKLYKYSEIVSSQISENGTTVTETSLDNAVVGGLLFGKTGAIVGGLTGKKSMSNNINELSLNLVFNDKTNPFYKFIFARCPGDGMSKTDKLYTREWDSINQWHNVFCLIIEENKKKYESGYYEHRDPVETNSRKYNCNTADELLKLAELREKGILTQDEFEAQKRRLLDGSGERVKVAKPDESVKVPESGGGEKGYSVILKDAGANKINVIRSVREITGLGLKDAKDFVEGVPRAIAENVPEEKAVSIEGILKMAGAIAEIR